MSIILHILGAPRVSRDGAVVSLPAKALAILGYLATARTSQRREHLLTLLWPDSGDEAARKNLRNTLWTIRRQLGAECIQASDDRLALGDAVDVDLWRLGALLATNDNGATATLTSASEALLGLYRGPLLDGLMLPDAPDFELWLTVERERVAQLAMRLLASLIDQHRAVGQWSQVIDLGHRVLSLDPLAEPVYQAIIEAHARLGERAEALHQFDILAATLEHELGVDPLPETVALRGRILDNALQPLVATERSVRRPAASTSAPALEKALERSSAAQPFVGRAAERERLNIELAQTTQAGLRIILLTGEVGIGKSRLLSEWVAGLPAEIAVLMMHCRESTQALPFAPLTDLFHHQIDSQTLFDRLGAVPLPWLAEVARLLPDLRASMPNLPVPPPLPADEERRRIFEAFAQCVRAMAGSRLVLGIDDMQWADRATGDWLDYIAHRLEQLPLLIVGTYREEESSPALQRLVAGWLRSGIAAKLPLERLSSAESADLLAQLGAHPGCLNPLHSASAGNPLFLLEMSRSEGKDMPEVLIDLIQARLARLPAAAAQILQAAAVLDPDFEFATLRFTAGRSEEETLDGLDALLQAAMVTERGELYAFAHPLVAQAVRHNLSHARRVFLHRRAAQACERTHVGRLAPIAGRLVAHYRAAGEAEQAAFYADMAAEHAASLAALAETLAFRREAVALAPTPARFHQLGRALTWSGDLPEARQTFETALDGYKRADDWPGAAAICARLGESYLNIGRPEVTIEWAERGLALIRDHAIDDAALKADLHLLLGISERFAGYPLHRAQRHLQIAHEVATTRQLKALMGRCQFEIGNALAQRGDLKAALLAFDNAIADSTAAGDYFQTVLAHNNAAYNATLAGDLASAHQHIEQAMALAETWSLRLPLQYLYSTRGELALAEGDWSAATEWFERGIRESAAQDNAAQVANYRANLGLAARGRGDLDQALALLRTAASEAAMLTAPYLQSQIDLWLAETWHMHGDELAARVALSRAQERLVNNEAGWLAGWASRVDQTLTQV